MSGNRKKGKGKGSEKDQGDKSAFQVDLSKEKGETTYIPGSFWGLKDDGGNRDHTYQQYWQYVGMPPFGDVVMPTTPEPSDTDADHSSPDQTKKTPPPKKKKETKD